MTKKQLELKIFELEAKVLALESRQIQIVPVPVYYPVYQQQPYYLLYQHQPYYPQIYYTYQPQYLGQNYGQGGMSSGGLV